MLEQQLNIFEQQEIETKESPLLLLTPPQARFTQAQMKLLFDEFGKPLPKYRKIVDMDNHDRIFTIVTSGYKIAQHDDVVNTVEKILAESELNNIQKVYPMNDGGRIRMIIKFPDETIKVNDETIKLNVTFDNSYDSTTGVRLEIGAYLGKKYFTISDRYSTFYHRHTKGLEIENLKKKLEKGINVFQEKFNEAFQQMLEKPLSKQQAIDLLDKWIEAKTKGMAAKYLNMVKELINTGSYEGIVVRDNVTNIWLFYNLISEIFSNKIDSVDAQKRAFQAVYKKLIRL